MDTFDGSKALMATDAVATVDEKPKEPTAQGRPDDHGSASRESDGKASPRSVPVSGEAESVRTAIVTLRLRSCEKCRFKVCCTEFLAILGEHEMETICRKLENAEHPYGAKRRGER